MLPHEVLNIVNPYDEVIAFELLCSMSGMTEAKLSRLFKMGELSPSQVLKNLEATGDVNWDNNRHLLSAVKSHLDSKLGSFSVCFQGGAQYPADLRRAKYPIELFYYRGNLDLLNLPAISIVGAREATHEGKLRAERLAKELGAHGYVIVSGLAKGIDTSALSSAINNGHRTIAVIGTPIDEYYPPENKALQNLISKDHLLISQIPFYLYKTEPFQAHRYHFPRRNITMAAISEATIIVEASDTSGTLTQARACIHQEKKLFILDSCFENSKISWPEKFLKRGAIRVSSTKEIIEALALSVPVGPNMYGVA